MSRRPGLILQHGEDGPPGLFAEWLHSRGIPAEIHDAWSEPLPADPSRYGWICSLGSEHTPGKPEAPAWVEAEIGFLRESLAAETPVLGLCFGGQALAAAAGGRVEPAEPAEVGWIEIETDAADAIPAGPWLHFHFDQLEAPAAATVLAGSPAGTAAFRLGPHLGLQFHPEATPAIVARWAELDRRNLSRAGTDPERLAAEGEAAEAAAREAAFRLFDAWWESLPTPSPA